MPLPRKRLARLMVGSVDLLMTVDAATIDDADAATLNREVVVDRRGMARPDVAPLAEHRQLCHQQAIVGRTVGVVTRDAALAAGRVLEQERSTLLRVA